MNGDKTRRSTQLRRAVGLSGVPFQSSRDLLATVILDPECDAKARGLYLGDLTDENANVVESANDDFAQRTFGSDKNNSDRRKQECCGTGELISASQQNAPRNGFKLNYWF